MGRIRTQLFSSPVPSVQFNSITKFNPNILVQASMIILNQSVIFPGEALSKSIIWMKFDISSSSPYLCPPDCFAPFLPTFPLNPGPKEKTGKSIHGKLRMVPSLKVCFISGQICHQLILASQGVEEVGCGVSRDTFQSGNIAAMVTSK